MLSLGVSFGFIAVVFAVGYASHFGLPSGVAKQDYLSLGRQTESGQFLALPPSALEVIYEATPEISWFHAEPLFDLRFHDRNGMQHPLRARQVSNNYFAVLDVALREAKALPAGGLEPAAVVSDSLWRRLRDANGETAGTFLYLQGDVALPIVGVAPPQFKGLFGRPVDAWIFNPPLALWREHDLLPTTEEVRRRTPRKRVFGVREAKTSIAGLQLLLDEYRFETTPIVVRDPASGFIMNLSFGLSDGDRLQVVTGLETAPGKRSDVRQRLVWLAGIALLLLALAHASLVDFLMAQNAARQHEQGIRIAVGATPANLFAEAVVKNLLWTAGVAAIAWVSFAYIHDVLIGFEPFSGYLGETASTPNPAGLIASVALLAATFALAVAQVSRSAMKTSRSFAWSADPTTMSVLPATRGMLMFVAAISLMFVFSLVNRYLGDTRAPLGFRNLNATIISISSSNLAALLEGVTQQKIRAAIGGVPTVQSAAQASMMPLSTIFQGSHHEVALVGNTDLGPRRMFANRVTPDYFPTLGVKLLAGRFFAAQARDEVVVAQSTAEMLANTVEQSLGMTLTLQAAAAVSASPGTSLPASSVKVVVGVVADIPYGHYTDQPRPVIYENAGGERSGTNWIVRHNGDPADIVASLEKSGASESWRVAVAGTLASRLQEQFTAKRSVEMLLSGAAGFALALALAGIAASLAGAIAADRRRIGISLALGATNLHLLFSRCFKSILRDLLVGLLLACALTPVLKVLAPLSMSILELWLIPPIAVCLLSVCAMLAWLQIRRLAEKNTINQLIH